MSSYSQADSRQAIERLMNEIRDVFLHEQCSSVPNETVQAFVGLALKLYVCKLNESPDMLPFAEQHDISATDAVIAVSRMLKQVDVQIFELAMWQTMGTVK